MNKKYLTSNAFFYGTVSAIFLLGVFFHTTHAFTNRPPASALNPGDITTSLILNGTILGEDINTAAGFRLMSLGIGSTSPTGLLSAEMGTSTPVFFVGDKGTTSPLFIIANNGFTGLGTSTPSSLLSVHGDTFITGSTTVGSIIATSTLFVGNTTGSSMVVLGSGNVGIGTLNPLGQLDVNGKLTVLSGGNVGIGTTSPGSLLAAKGININTGTSTFENTAVFSRIVATSTFGLGTLGYTPPINHNASSSVLMNDGTGSLSWGSSGDWVQLAQTITTSATTGVQVLGIPNRRYFHVLVKLGARSASASYDLMFNGDTGLSYANRTSYNGTQTPQATRNQINLTGNNDTASTTFVIDIDNSNFQNKQVLWYGMADKGLATAPEDYRGSGIWTGSTTAISRIDITPLSAVTFAAPSVITVYGSKD